MIACLASLSASYALVAVEEGPWHVVVEGQQIGRVGATDPGATNEWHELAEKRSGKWKWLGATETTMSTRTWTVTVGPSAALSCDVTVGGVTYLKCQKVKTTFVAGSSPVKPKAPFVTVPTTGVETAGQYHQTGHYTITASTGATATYYVAAASEGAVRYEVVCGPANFPWPADDDADNPTDAAVSWTIGSWASGEWPNPNGSDLTAKLACPSGTTQRARHTVNLLP